jgi:hypothetical protein
MQFRYAIRALKRNPLFFTKLFGAKSRAQKFIEHLIGINMTEAKRYNSEVMSDSKFQGNLQGKFAELNQRGLTTGEMSNPFAKILYIIVRSQRPAVVVETGVANGLSSAYILCALERNQHGKLYSIDLPCVEGIEYPNGYFKPEGLDGTIPRGEQSGWLIPDYLRRRWELTLGRTSDRLKPLLGKLGTIDIFLHDSEHSYQNMLWEYKTVWIYLKKGGILLSHDVEANNAFNDFCGDVQSDGLVFNFVFTSMGGVVKGGMEI